MDEYNNQFSAPDEGEYTAPTSAEYAESYVTPYEEETAPNKTMGIISMICAIAGVAINFLSICLGVCLSVIPCAGFCVSLLPPVLYIAAIVLAVVEKKKNGEMSVFGKIGMIASIVLLALSVIGSIISAIVLIATYGFAGLMSMAEGMGSSSSYYYY